jgi:SAM domain (Sterile alpha motif)
VLPSSVDEWLVSLKMERYASVFKDNGYDLLDAFVGLDDANLIALNVAMGHRNILLRGAAKLAQHFV